MSEAVAECATRIELTGGSVLGGESVWVAALYHIGPDRESSRGWVVPFKPNTTSLDGMFDSVMRAMRELCDGVKADKPGLVPYPAESKSD